MNRLPLAALALLLVAAVPACRRAPADADAPRWVPAARAGIRQTLAFQGELEARTMLRVAVPLQGSAVLEELVAEGTRVHEGDVLARFDSAQIAQDLARQESEAVRARQELDSLEKAELPLERLDLESRRDELLAALRAEEAFLDAATGLRDRGLMSDAELLRQRGKIAAVRADADRAATRLDLTAGPLHAARLAKARAALEAAERQRDYTARQLALCTVTAPAGGTVSLVPLPVGGEYRTARVGDSLYRNQVFLCIPRDDARIVRGHVEESALPSVRPGAPATAVPAAFPDLRLPGRVESVGSMARSLPGQPAWRKYFPVAVALDPLPQDQDLPAGLTMNVEIVSGEAPSALAIPRAALESESGRLYVQRRPAAALPSAPPVRTEVRIGLADTASVQILSGLSDGDLVLCP